MESSDKQLPKLLVKKLNKGALMPVKGSAFAAGYDLHALTDATIPARGKALVGTGLAFAIPEGNYGRIAPRSGLAAKHSIDVGAGVIDSDYRGEVKVLLFNLSDVDFTLKAQERCAQLIIEKYTPTEILEVEGMLDETARGAGGFGSTGVAAMEEKAGKLQSTGENLGKKR